MNDDRPLPKAINAFTALVEDVLETGDHAEARSRLDEIKRIREKHLSYWRPQWEQRPLPKGAYAEFRVQGILRAAEKAAEKILAAGP